MTPAAAAPTVTVLLVEDNPGDARLILELLGALARKVREVLDEG